MALSKQHLSRAPTSAKGTKSPSTGGMSSNTDYSDPLAMQDLVGNQGVMDMIGGLIDAPTPLGESRPQKEVPGDLLRMMERTSGESLQEVTLDESPEAQAEVAAAGGKAAAVDGRILLGPDFPGEDTAIGRQILLHELSHLAGSEVSGTPEGTTLQGKSQAGSKTEAGADSMAAAALAGTLAPSHSGGLDRGEVGLWNSSEHHELGNEAYQEAANLSVVRLPEDVVGGNSDMTFGEASALSGDLVSSPEDLLGMDQSSTESKLDFMWEINEESESKLSVGWTSVIEDRNNGIPFITDAFHNSNHFYPLVHTEYSVQHQAAVESAKTAFEHLQQGNDALYDSSRRQALTQEAFASHFLQDSFASGHQYPCADSVDSLSRMNFHDEINGLTNGLPMTDGRHHGDGAKTSSDQDAIVELNSASIQAVMLEADQGGGGETTAQIVSRLPGPDETAILADKDAAPVWTALSKDRLNLDAGSIISADPLTGRGMPGSEMEEGLSSSERPETAAGTHYAMGAASADVYEVIDQSTSLGASLQTEEKPTTAGKGGLATRGSLVLTILQDLGMTLGLSTWNSVGACAVEAGILDDVWQTSFMNVGDSPDLRLFDPVTRCEAAVMVQRAYGIADAGPKDVDSPFTDVDGVPWAQGAIYGLVKEGWVQGYGDGRFGPADNLQADDQTKMIHKE